MIKKIMLDYERKRDKAEYELEERLKKIYASIPRLEEIELENRKTVLAIAKLTMFNKNNESNEVLELKGKMELLKEEKESLFKINNINKSMIEIQYECSKCCDTGYITLKNENGDFLRKEKCSCLKQEIIKARYINSNLSHLLENQNFENFDYNIFSSEKVNGDEISQRENMINIVEISEFFIENFDDNRLSSLLFYGGTGLGKTYLCSCISKELINNGKTVLYQTAGDLMDIIIDKKFDRGGLDNRQKYEDIFDCDLLIIDDLGTEPINNATLPEIFTVINKRIIMNKKTIISTNLDFKNLEETYTTRITSRIFEEYQPVKFVGEDIRYKKAFGI